MPYVFDRLSAFEEWLEEPDTETSAQTPRPRVSSDEAPDTAEPKRPRLSKNKRDQLEREVAELEKKIASVEGEIAELELSFQNPATGTDWETTHRRYADLKIALDGLYADLATRWETMGEMR